MIQDELNHQAKNLSFEEIQESLKFLSLEEKINILKELIENPPQIVNLLSIEEKTKLVKNLMSNTPGLVVTFSSSHTTVEMVINIYNSDDQQLSTLIEALGHRVINGKQ